MRWIWIDRFEEFHSRTSAVAVKLVSSAEDHLYEQSPMFPVMPHSLILEELAQTGGVLLGEANDFAEKVVLAKITSAKFYGFAAPGDELRYEVQLVDVRAEGGVTSCRALRNGELMAEAEIFFAHLDPSRIDGPAPSEDNFVFTKGHLRSLLRGVRGTYEAAANERE